MTSGILFLFVNLTWSMDNSLPNYRLVKCLCMPAIKFPFLPISSKKCSKINKMKQERKKIMLFALSWRDYCIAHIVPKNC